MEIEGIRYVFVAYAVVAVVLVVWLWMIAAKISRIDRAAAAAREESSQA